MQKAKNLAPLTTDEDHNLKSFLKNRGIKSYLARYCSTEITPPFTKPEDKYCQGTLEQVNKVVEDPVVRLGLVTNLIKNSHLLKMDEKYAYSRDNLPFREWFKDSAGVWCQGEASGDRLQGKGVKIFPQTGYVHVGYWKDSDNKSH